MPIRTILAALVVTLLPAAHASADTFTAASCSLANVRSAIASASNGDTVRVPAGSCTWNDRLSLSKGIHLAGAGASALTVRVTRAIRLEKNASTNVELSGFRFVRNGGGNAGTILDVIGAWTAEPPLIHDNVFSVNNAAIMRYDTNGGVIYRNTFNGAENDSALRLYATADTQSWSTADTLGTRDNTGKLNLYVEDNEFNGLINQAVDFGDAARIVLRHNTVNNSVFNSHGLSTSPIGARHFEIYENDFNFPDSSVNLNSFIWLRGGTGVVFDNTLDDINGQQWGNKRELNLSVRMANDGGVQGCATGWPAPHQVGQNHDGTRQFTDPVRFWGNVGALAWSIRSFPSTCGLDITDYLREGRDFVFASTPKPGYSAYTYPHPMRADGGEPPPPPPPPPPIDAPERPDGVSASPVSSSRIAVNWNASSGADSYEVFRCAGGGCTPTNQVGAASQNSTSFGALDPSTLYRFRVRAVGADGQRSDYSAVAAATTLAVTPGNGNSYYVDRTAGLDSNPGTQAAPWRNAPGMSGSSAYTGNTTLEPGDTVFFDRDDVWTLTGGPQGLYLTGGVRYVGNAWAADGSGSGRATLRAGNDFNENGVVRFRDHPTLETEFEGFIVDVDGKSANGIDINHGFWSLMAGATKRVSNVEVFGVFSEQSRGEYKYGIAMSNWGGDAGVLENVEILDCVVHDVSRDAIVLYPSDNPDSRIGRIVVRGCEIYNTGQDPGYDEGHGIVVKGWVYDAVIEHNFVHDVNSSAIFISGPDDDGAQRGADDVTIRHNILSSQDNNGIVRLYKRGAKDVRLYGNLLFDNSETGGLSLAGNSGPLDLRVYNNTFYNAFVDLGGSNSNVGTFAFRNNIVQFQNSPLRNSGSITSQGNNLLVTANPGLRNPGSRPTGFVGTYGSDLRPNSDGLQPTAASAAVDAGASIGNSYASSINSVSRPAGSAWDIGAYESAADGPPPPLQLPAPSNLRFVD